MASAISRLLETLATNLPNGVLRTSGGTIIRAIPDRDFSPGGRPGVHPSQLSGLTSLHDASSLFALSRGDAVTSWPDSSGNNYTITASNSLAKYQPEGSNGWPGVYLPGNNSGSGLGNPSIPTNMSAFTEVVVFSTDYPGQGYAWITGFDTSGNQGVWSGGGPFAIQGPSNQSTQSGYPYILGHRAPGMMVLIITSDGTNVRFYSNGEYNSTAVSFPSVNTLGVVLGGTSTYSASVKGVYALQALYNRALTDAECRAVMANLMAKYNPGFLSPPKDKPLVVFTGDSLLSGVAVLSRSNIIVEKVMDTLGRGTVSYLNLSAGGQPWDGMIAQGAFVDTLYSADRAENWLVCLENVNQPSNAKAQDYVSARAAAGWKVALMTAPGSVYCKQSNSYSAHLALNAQMRTNYITWGAKRLIDVALDPRLGVSGSVGSPTEPFVSYPEYWEASPGNPGGHWNDAGSALAARHIEAGIGPNLRGVAVHSARMTSMTSDVPGQTAVVRRTTLAFRACYNLTLTGTIRRTDTGTEYAVYRRVFRITTGASGSPTITPITTTGVGFIDYSASGMSTADVSVVPSSISPGEPAIDILATGESGKTLLWSVEYRLNSAD